MEVLESLSLIHISHGNATVEGGFSVNKSLLVENLQEHSLFAVSYTHLDVYKRQAVYCVCVRVHAHYCYLIIRFFIFVSLLQHEHTFRSKCHDIAKSTKAEVFIIKTQLIFH